MSTFKRAPPASEKDLHFIIENNLGMIEEGLSLLKREQKLRDGIPDFLCIDSGGRLVIIEVKKTSEDRAIFQALRYYSTIHLNIYNLKTVYSSINTDYPPRIILIAETFSDNIRKIVPLVTPDLTLFEYTTLIDTNGKKGIVFHPISIPEYFEEISTPTTYSDHRDYMTKPELKLLFEELRKTIKEIDPNIEEYSTGTYIGYKLQGRQFAYLKTQRKSFDLGAIVLNSKGQVITYENTRFESPAEPVDTMMAMINESYQILLNLLNNSD